MRRRIHACHMRRRIPAMHARSTHMRRRIHACHMRRRIPAMHARLAARCKAILDIVWGNNRFSNVRAPCSYTLQRR
jgi:hypothetical protein